MGSTWRWRSWLGLGTRVTRERGRRQDSGGAAAASSPVRRNRPCHLIYARTPLASASLSHVRTHTRLVRVVITNGEPISPRSLVRSEKHSECVVPVFSSSALHEIARRPTSQWATPTLSPRRRSSRSPRALRPTLRRWVSRDERQRARSGGASAAPASVSPCRQPRQRLAATEASLSCPEKNWGRVSGSRRPLTPIAAHPLAATHAKNPTTGAPNPANPLVYFDIALGRYGDATPLGRVVMEVKEDVTPKTARNFVELAQAAPGQGFKASRFHRGTFSEGGRPSAGVEKGRARRKRSPVPP